MRRLLMAATMAAISGTSLTAQQPIDYSKLEITTTDLGQGLYLLNWQGGDDTGEPEAHHGRDQPTRP